MSENKENLSESDIIAMTGRHTLNSAYRFGNMKKDGGVVAKGEDIIKEASAANVTQAQSFWYSPEMTSDSWLLPKSRQEILKWVRIFFNLEPFIQNILLLRAYYPFSRFELNSQDDSVTEFYKEMSFNENFDLFYYILQSSLSYEKFGEALHFLNKEKISEGPWSGSMRWKNGILLEPELVEIESALFGDGKITFALVATEEMKKIVGKMDENELLQKGVPQEVITAIKANKNIPLDNNNVSQIARITDPSATRGTAPIQCCFKCLSGDTIIPLLNGKNKSIKQLYEEKAKNIYVYSINPETQNIASGLVEEVMLNDVNREMVKITLDDDSSFKCTPDHKIMLRDGNYCEAKDLLENESLMPLYKDICKDKDDIICDLKELVLINHKVKKAEFLAEREDVYDLINSKPYHNFAILTSDMSGIFVKNSLVYQDKIRLAQVAAADRYHMPVELWTVGDIANNILPTPDQLDSIRDMINQAIQSPPFSMVFPPYIKYEALGVTGKLLPVKEDYDYLQDQIMVGLGVNKNLITGDGPSFCLDDKSRIVTKSGLKFHGELTMEDEVMTFNPETEEYEYHKPTNIFKFDYEGHLIHFNTNSVDLMVTPNHRCWAKQRYKGEWGFVEAKDVQSRSQMRVGGKWIGEQQREFITVANEQVKMEDWFKFMGYWISEGWGNGYNVKNGYKRKDGTISNKERKKAWRLGIGQSIGSDCIKDIEAVCDALPFKHGKYSYQCKYISKKTNKLVAPQKSFVWCNKDLTQFVISEAGQNSFVKHIPVWMKNAEPKYLKLILDALIKGDGNERVATRKAETDKIYYTYITTSKQLAEDICEICFKLGYMPTLKDKNDKGIYLVYFSDSDQNLNGIHCLDSKSISNVISPFYYKGIVWCAEVPNHIFMVERNGKFILTGNSNLKSMSLQNFTMMAKTKRDLYESWMINKFYRPIALDNKFYYQKGKEKVLVLPQITWYKSLDIEEEAEERKLYIDMHEKGYVSTETLFTKFPSLDYATERSKLEKEAGTVFDKNDRIPKEFIKNDNAGGGGGRPSPVVLGPGEEETIKPETPLPGAETAPVAETPVAETPAPTPAV